MIMSQSRLNILEVKSKDQGNHPAYEERQTGRTEESDRKGRDEVRLREPPCLYWRAGINLTAKEFDMLELLALNQNKVYSREKLLNLVWGYDYPGDARTVDVHIRACGRKLRAIQVIQSMCIQSGELVIILGDKIYFRGKFF